MFLLGILLGGAAVAGIVYARGKVEDGTDRQDSREQNIGESCEEDPWCYKSKAEANAEYRRYYDAYYDLCKKYTELLDKYEKLCYKTERGE